MGNALLETGRAGEALQAYRAAVRLDARSAQARNGLAKALTMHDRDEKDNRACRRAAEREAHE